MGSIQRSKFPVIGRGREFFPHPLDAEPNTTTLSMGHTRCHMTCDLGHTPMQSPPRLRVFASSPLLQLPPHLPHPPRPPHLIGWKEMFNDRVNTFYLVIWLHGLLFPMEGRKEMFYLTTQSTHFI